MITITFSELRNNAKKYFDAVEAGETVEVCRHGKPVAMLSPVASRSGQRWQQARPLRIDGHSLSQIVLDQRREST